jgi:hypothetical protein
MNKSVKVSANKDDEQVDARQPVSRVTKKQFFHQQAHVLNSVL